MVKMSSGRQKTGVKKGFKCFIAVRYANRVTTFTRLERNVGGIGVTSRSSEEIGENSCLRKAGRGYKGSGRGTLGGCKGWGDILMRTLGSGVGGDCGYADAGIYTLGRCKGDGDGIMGTLRTCVCGG
mmetsp:Transcript_32959/g.33273  ORF Transcript_32959/g.33273 Transcript_32959/m.33273 type:complete len:127 (-) Transcript_32959:826-1206(-)